MIYLSYVAVLIAIVFTAVLGMHLLSESIIKVLNYLTLYVKVKLAGYPVTKYHELQLPTFRQVTSYLIRESKYYMLGSPGAALCTTLKLLRKRGACTSGYKKLRRRVGLDFPDDELISLITVLDSNGLYDALWCLQATTKNSSKASALLGCEFTQLALDRTKHPHDKLLRAALKFARRHVVETQTTPEKEAERQAERELMLSSLHRVSMLPMNDHQRATILVVIDIIRRTYPMFVAYYATRSGVPTEKLKKTFRRFVQ